MSPADNLENDFNAKSTSQLASLKQAVEEIQAIYSSQRSLFLNSKTYLLVSTYW
jgi:hypothetical protein